MMQRASGRGRLLPVLAGLAVGLSLAAIMLSVFTASDLPLRVRRELMSILAGSEEEVGRVINDQAAANGSISVGRRNAVVQATDHVLPAVVSIFVTQVERYTQRPRYLEDFFEQFFRRPRTVEREVYGLGSGVIVTPYGRVITNNHVTGGATHISVILSDGREYSARILASSSKYDVSLLQLDLAKGEVLPYAEFGDSDDLMIGEWAIAIGSPFGFHLNDTRPTVTVGVISALHRNVKSEGDVLFSDMIQTDAPINVGNSGGPLVNSLGQVIGLNTFIFTQGGGSLGIGFARPINVVNWLMDEFEKYGRVRDAWMGLEAYEIQPFHVVRFNLPVDHGLLVSKVFTDGPADSAGILPADVIVAIAGQEIRNSVDANNALFPFEVGSLVPLEINRNGEKIEVEVILAAYSEQGD